MAIPLQYPRGDPYREPDSPDYTSNVLRLFVEGLERRQEMHLLDIGPVCSENISFFALRVTRIYVCDMFLRFDRERRRGLHFSRALRHLDYPSQSFDGILLWDLADHLDDVDARRLIELCYHMLKPGGMMMVLVLGEQWIPPLVNSFVIGNGCRLRLRPQPHLDLPLYVRQNRKILSLLTPFTPVKSFIYRNGFREFLFRRDYFNSST